MTLEAQIRKQLSKNSRPKQGHTISISRKEAVRWK